MPPLTRQARRWFRATLRLQRAAGKISEKISG
jgi:hypothetical protein